MGRDPSEDEDEPKPTRPQSTTEWSFSSPMFGGGANPLRTKPKVLKQDEPKPNRPASEDDLAHRPDTQHREQEAAPIAPVVAEAQPVTAPQLFPQTRPTTPDYSELKAIEPATAAKPQPAQAHEPAIIDTTPQGLQNILDRYAQVREAAKITPDAHDLQARQQDAAVNDEHRDSLRATHKTERQVIDPDQATDLAAKHDKESDLLSYEALAGQVYTEAKIMMRHLKDANPREAARCENESLAVVSTAKFLDIERRELRGDIENDIKAIPAHVRDERQKKAEAQEAVLRGEPLTPEQSANAPANAQTATSKKDRDEKAADRTGDQKHDQPEKGATIPTGRGGGRSGGRGR